jgi:hypothetical protein
VPTQGSELASHEQECSEFVTLASELERSWQHRMIRSHEHADPGHIEPRLAEQLSGEARICSSPHGDRLGLCKLLYLIVRQTSLPFGWHLM